MATTLAAVLRESDIGAQLGALCADFVSATLLGSFALKRGWHNHPDGATSGSCVKSCSSSLAAEQGELPLQPSSLAKLGDAKDPEAVSEVG